MRRFGPITIGRVRDASDLKKFLTDHLLKTDVFIVKPSWYSPHPANFTDAETLRILLEALEGRVVVTEAYSLDRQDGGMRFTVGGEEVDWRWIMRNPDWGWAMEEGRWSEFRRQDRWFLDEHGFTDLFQEHGVEYVNVTEEVWRGRTADPGKVRDEVEARYAPAFKEELYSYVPSRLYELRGATLISYGKVKGIGGTFPSLTMKNMFGFIPDPLRSLWHGPDDRWLGKSIVDVNKVYAALFNVYGICEAIRHTTISHPQGEVKVPWGGYNIIRDLGVVALGRPLVTLDAVLCGLIGVDPEEVSYLKLGEEAFGAYDRSLIEEAKMAASDWFPYS